MDHERKPRTAVTREQALEPAVVIDVAMGDHDRAQVLHGDAEHVEVAGEAVGREPRVVEHRAAAPARLDGDERGEPVLGDELAAVGQVGREVSRHALRPRQQDVDEVVHDDRDLGAIDRLEPHGRLVRRPEPTARGRSPQAAKATRPA